MIFYLFPNLPIMILQRTAIVLLTLWAAVCASAQEEKPWVAEAVRFMSEDFAAAAKNLGGRQFSVMDGMVRSSATTRQRHVELQTKWEGIARMWWKTEELQVAALADWRQGDLAAVVLQLTDLDRPLSHQVVALGMLRSDEGKWRVGPALGSLENMKASLASDVLEGIDQGNIWILNRLPKLIVDSREKTQGEFYRKISLEEKNGIISGDDPLKVVERYAELVQKRDLYGVLAYHGGLDRPLPADWEMTVEEVSNDLANTIGAADASTFSLPIDTMEATRVFAEVIVAEYYASSHVLSLKAMPLSRGEDHWKIHPDDAYEVSPAEGNIGQGEYKLFQESFAKRFYDIYGSTGFDSLDALRQESSSIRPPGEMHKTWQFFEPDVSAGTPGHLLNYITTLKLIFAKDEKGEVPRRYVDTLQKGDVAAFVYAFFDKDALELKLLAVNAVKFEGKWYLSRNLEEFGSPELKKEFDDAREELRRKAMASDMEQIMQLPDFPTGEAPTIEAAREAALHYRDTLGDALDLGDALKFAVRLPDSLDEAEILKTLNYVRKGAQAQIVDHEVIGISTKDAVTAVSVHIPSKRGIEGEDILIYTVMHGDEVRVLCDVDIRYPRSSARKRLNRRIWRRLDAKAPEFSKTLQALYADHEKRVQENDKKQAE